MASLDEAAARLRKNDPMLGDALALRLAEAGTRVVEDGFTWKHDPLHMTMGPYPYRRDAAAQYWSKITCPVLAVDAAQSKLNLSEAERAARRGYFASCRHVTIDQAGHMLQRHQPEQLARLLLELL
jgi:pimeloyl-ACP methyl ester carboxylesterase